MKWNDVKLTNQPIEHAVNCAINALHYEVSLSPKPGLVDPQSNGAHTDMNVFTFISSITSLAPFFIQYIHAGFYHQQSYISLFEELREIGKQAESAMMTATKGINTHKGANFSFAILLGATGCYYQQTTVKTWTKSDTDQLFNIAAALCRHLVECDLQGLNVQDELSYGQKNYLTYGLTGIRGEAVAGYPTVQKLLNYLRRLPDEGNIKLLRGLVYLMSETEDSNLVHRGGYEAMKEVQCEMKKIHEANLPKSDLLHVLTAYDQVLIDRHLSPGGSADLLALAIYFLQLEGFTFW
ncbi:triphosphoribosyl-dephospho-CoA synthase CitG [Enterococcus sp. RIT-PI-f]|uniref:triphosphoribosyl-dephospho-CoA synthase CitG n=1 Tax=Enterococcus sp. RIT-PI-f TaxID=1690244 RepID=UPI0006B8E193|nr:triphosphoribosyl-dephospho-CoA synthase CitG [Enterococcus sp. RIT-PI-f]KPG73899.1 2-(5'-triphosphoribosyl)-3'-dephospho CoA synthase [Enterococcus sp. RIT-PI-f]